MSQVFLHEVHTLVGPRWRDFEAAMRDEWQHVLHDTGRGRLLWYCHQAHGTGFAYTVITITAFEDARAWQDVAVRVASGDLRSWAAQLDESRHDVTGKLLLPVPWSPLQEVDLGVAPDAALDHEPALVMEDTGWPYEGGLDAYVDGLGQWYRPLVAGSALIDLQACFQPAYGQVTRREAILWQRLKSTDNLLRLLTHEEPPSYPEDSWMTKALALRDRWESRLLRTAPWSPVF